MKFWLLGTGSRKKKDSTAEDSDDEGEGTTVHPSGGKNKAHCKCLGINLCPAK